MKNVSYLRPKFGQLFHTSLLYSDNGVSIDYKNPFLEVIELSSIIKDKKSFFTLLNKIFFGFIYFDKIAIAISGGKDSMCLLSLLDIYLKIVGAKTKLHIINIDHGLRAESFQETVFIKQRTQQLGHKYYYQKITIAKESSNQSFLRKQRYKAIIDICIKNNINIFLTAHTINDYFETVEMRAKRNNNASNYLVLPVRQRYRVDNKYLLCFRPLLTFTSAEIILINQNLNIKYKEDPSNKLFKYERNLVRHKIVTNEYINKFLSDSYKVNKITELFQQTKELGKRLENIFFKAGGVFHPLGYIYVNKKKLQSFSYEDIYFLFIKIINCFGLKYLSFNNNQFTKHNLQDLFERRSTYTVANVLIRNIDDVFFFCREPGYFTRYRNNILTVKFSHNNYIWDNRFLCTADDKVFFKKTNITAVNCYDKIKDKIVFDVKESFPMNKRLQITKKVQKSKQIKTNNVSKTNNINNDYINHKYDFLEATMPLFFCDNNQVLAIGDRPKVNIFFHSLLMQNFFNQALYFPK